jgi:hypothetical protein
LTSGKKAKISAAMSGHGDHADEHAADGDATDDHDDHHAPPPLEEPATPLWLTLLGVGLFLTAGILFVATRADGKTTAELTAVPSAEAPAASAAPEVRAPNPTPAPNPAAANPAMRPGNAPNPAAAPGNPGAVRVNPTPGRPPGGGSKQPGHEGHDHD